MNRRKILKLGSGFLPLLFGHGLRVSYEITRGGLPARTTIVGAQMTLSNPPALMLLLESDHWDEVPDGQPYPEIEPIFATIRPLERPLHEVSIN